MSKQDKQDKPADDLGRDLARELVRLTRPRRPEPQRPPLLGLHEDDE